MLLLQPPFFEQLQHQRLGFTFCFSADSILLFSPSMYTEKLPRHQLTNFFHSGEDSKFFFLTTSLNKVKQNKSCEKPYVHSGSSNKTVVWQPAPHLTFSRNENEHSATGSQFVPASEAFHQTVETVNWSLAALSWQREGWMRHRKDAPFYPELSIICRETCNFSRVLEISVKAKCLL